MALASGHWLEKEIKGEAPSPRLFSIAGSVYSPWAGESPNKNVSRKGSKKVTGEELLHTSAHIYLTFDCFIRNVCGAEQKATNGPNNSTWFTFGYLSYLLIVSFGLHPFPCIMDICSQALWCPICTHRHVLVATGTSNWFSKTSFIVKNKLHLMMTPPSVVKGSLYLFGGASSPDATECLPGVYSFDIVTLTWECLAVGGVALRALRHCSAAAGENIYVYGGAVEGNPSDDLMVFNTVSLTWTPVRTSGSLPPALWGQSCALVGDQVFMFGGYGAGGDFCKDLYVLNTENLQWQKMEVKGESPAACSGQTLTAHHDKDIYLFGGKSTNEDGTVTSSSEIHKLSIAKTKWKVPLYVGIPPTRRHGHTTFILHSHLYVFGGKNEEQNFNDLKVMKLINPSERQPVMKEILSEFGLQGISHSFTPTKVPNVRYELSEAAPSVQQKNTMVNPQVFVHRDFSAVRDQAMTLIQTAFTLLDQEFHKLDREKSELTKAAAALQREKDAHEAHRQQQQQELQEMLDRHRSQNEAWLRARAEENDRERRELCRLREVVLQEQERLKEEQSNIQKRSEHLLSIMQQFKGM